MTEITDAMLSARISNQPAMVECYEVGDQTGGPTDTHASLKGAVNDFVRRFYRNKRPFIKFESGKTCTTKNEIIDELFKE